MLRTGKTFKRWQFKGNCGIINIILFIYMLGSFLYIYYTYCCIRTCFWSTLSRNSTFTIKIWTYFANCFLIQVYFIANYPKRFNLWLCFIHNDFSIICSSEDRLPISLNRNMMISTWCDGWMVWMKSWFSCFFFHQSIKINYFRGNNIQFLFFVCSAELECRGCWKDAKRGMGKFNLYFMFQQVSCRSTRYCFNYRTKNLYFYVVWKIGFKETSTFLKLVWNKYSLDYIWSILNKWS